MPTSTALPVTPTPAVLAGRIIVGESSKYQVQMRCLGQGSPAVVLDAGSRGFSRAWKVVQPEVAAFTRVCVYDRLGAVRRPLTAQQMAQDLHAVLQATGVDGPYVLVGASFAGLNVRLFAHQYPDEVAGMVLVDAVHEDVVARDTAVLPPESPNESQALKDIRKDLANGGDPTVNYTESDAQVRAAGGSLGDLPLVVLTAGKSEPPPDLEPDVAKRLDQSWLEMQKDLARLSSNSTHTIVEESGHDIQMDQPEAVIDAIRKVVEAARSR